MESLPLVVTATLVVALRLGSPLAAEAQSTPPRDPRADVLAREAQRRDSYMRLDSAGMAGLLSPDYLAASTESPCCFHDRAAAIRALVAHRDAVDPHPINAMRLDSARVRVFGNVAVVTGIETIDMTYPKHVPADRVSVRLLATNTWVNVRGEWMLVGQQRTPLR